MAELGRVSVNAERIRKLVQRADNDNEPEEALAEYLVGSALDVADALERVQELERENAELREAGKVLIASDRRSFDAARKAQERAERVEAAARAVVDVFAIPSGGVGWLARIADLRAALAAAPAEEGRDG